MRKSVKRALALVSAVPMLAGVVATAPAAHAALPGCPVGSTVLAEFDLLGGYHTRIATYDATATQKNLCIQLLQYEQMAIVLKTGVSITQPQVVQTPGTGRCAQPVIDMTSPVPLALSLGYSTSGTPSLCFGKDGVTTTISVTGASIQSLPAVEVWSGAHSILTRYGICAVEYARYQAGVGDFWDWFDCYAVDHRLV